MGLSVGSQISSVAKTTGFTITDTERIIRSYIKYVTYTAYSGTTAPLLGIATIYNVDKSPNRAEVARQSRKPVETFAFQATHVAQELGFTPKKVKGILDTWVQLLLSEVEAGRHVTVFRLCYIHPSKTQSGKPVFSIARVHTGKLTVRARPWFVQVKQEVMGL